MAALPTTENGIRGLTPAAGKAQAVFHDAKLPGLLLVVGRRGKSWALDYRADGKRRRHKLGAFPALGLAAARAAAKAAQGHVAGGDDPQGKRAARRTARTVGESLDDYREKHVAPKRTAGEMARLIEKHIRPALDRVKLPDLAPRHLVSVLDDVRAPIVRNRVATILRHFAGWLLDRDLIATDPARRLRKPTRESPRERTLDDGEIAALWRALDDAPASCRLALRLALLTGRRADEIVALPWREIDLDAAVWRLPGDRNKTGRDWTFPLASPVVDMLRAQQAITGGAVHVLPVSHRGRSGRPSASLARKAAAALRPTLATPWTVHDLRRTVRTGMARLGVAPHVAELCLGHVPGGIAAIYDRHRYQGEIAAAFDLWASHVMALVGGGPAVVVPIRRAG